MEDYGYFTDIAFNMLLANSTHSNDLTLGIGLESCILALKVGYATQEAKLESIMQTIKDVDINALRSIDPNNDKPERYMPYTYLMSEDLDKWT